MVTKSQINSNKHSEKVTTSRVSDKFWCDGVAFDYSILWMSHVHEILWEIILFQEKISICCVVLVNQLSFGRHRGCVVAFCGCFALRDLLPFTCPSENWGLASTPPNAVNEVDEHDDNNNDDATTNQGVSERDASYIPSDAPTSETPALAIRLPFVSADGLEIEDPIGYGRNGAVFRVWWKDQAYALKQFDTAGALGLQSYNRELQAYAMLQKAWGVL
jgi:hypothetical protein